MPTTLRGLTWDHPRAVLPLRAAKAALLDRLPDVRLSWDAQPLSGFETHPLTDIVQHYDVVIFDHPHVGDAAREGALRPLNALARRVGLADTDFAGPSLASYRHEGALWGVPVDAACQVACLRPDLMARLRASVPGNWDEVLTLGRQAREAGWWLAAALGGVHALMLLLTLCANQGAPLSGAAGPAFPDRGPARRALRTMRALAALCPPEVLGWNSIALQNAMVGRDDLVFCPAVYGFCTYARPGMSRVALRYSDLPGLDETRLGAAGQAGSTLGGAGIGISARCRAPEAAEAVAALLVSPELQIGIVAAAGGQPAHRAAWDDVAVDVAAGGFYSATRATIDAAWVRPRFARYLDFQRAGGPLVEGCLRGVDPERTLDRLDEAWSAAWQTK